MDSLEPCADCGRNRPGQRTRRLCQSCYKRHRLNGTVEQYPRVNGTSADLAEDFRALGLNEAEPISVRLRRAAQIFGVSFARIEQAYYRDRRARERGRA